MGLAGRTLGLFGLGKIGKAVSRRAQGFADSLSAPYLGGLESILWVPGGPGPGMRETVDWAISEGFDGIFLMSDERIADLLARRNKGHHH